jgi:hypothetical protein
MCKSNAFTDESDVAVLEGERLAVRLQHFALVRQK